MLVNFKGQSKFARRLSKEMVTAAQTSVKLWTLPNVYLRIYASFSQFREHLFLIFKVHLAAEFRQFFSPHRDAKFRKNNCKPIFICQSWSLHFLENYWWFHMYVFTSLKLLFYIFILVFVVPYDWMLLGSSDTFPAGQH